MKISHHISSISLLLICSLPTYALQKNQMENRCALLTQLNLKQVCKGEITRVIKLRFKDQMAPIGTAFAVFQSTAELSHYFVTFHKSILMICDTLKYPKTQKINCGDEKSYQFNRSQIHCFSFNVQYVDELVALCLDQEDKVGAKVDKSAFVALHYVRTPSIGSASTLTVSLSRCWPMLLGACICGGGTSTYKFFGWLAYV